MSQEASRVQRPAAALTVILQDDGTGDLIDCLKALLSTTGSGRTEILVLGQPGQKPPELPADILKAEPTWLTLSGHAGFASAANAGWRYSTGQALLFLSPEIVVQGRCLLKSLSFLNRFTDIGAATCRIEDEEGRFLPICRELPNIRSSLLYGLTFLPAQAKPIRDFLGRWMTRYHTGTYDRYIGWTPAGFLIVRREALERAGGFNEALTREGALMDLHRRLSAAGYRNACISEAAATESAAHPRTYPASACARGTLEYIRAHGTRGMHRFFRYLSAARQCFGLLSFSRSRRSDAWKALRLSLASTTRQ